MIKRRTKRKAKKVIAKVRAPRGFYFKITENKVRNDWDDTSHEVNVKLFLSSTGKKVGRINLFKYGKSKHFETHSNLDDEFQNKGIGVKLYARAIQWCLENGHKVSSSGSSSQDAERVWNGKRIRQYFSLRKINRWGNDKWFAYAKVQA